MINPFFCGCFGAHTQICFSTAAHFSPSLKLSLLSTSYFLALGSADVSNQKIRLQGYDIEYPQHSIHHFIRRKLHVVPSHYVVLTLEQLLNDFSIAFWPLDIRSNTSSVYSSSSCLRNCFSPVTVA